MRIKPDDKWFSINEYTPKIDVPLLIKVGTYSGIIYEEEFEAVYEPLYNNVFKFWTPDRVATFNNVKSWRYK